MLKFLRRYNKIILVLGGCFLMVAFTLPQLPQLFGGTALSQKIAVIEDTTITGGEFRDIQQDWQIAQQILGPAPLGISETNHYMLLRYEADKYGLIGGQRDGEALIPRYAELIVRSQRFASFFPEEQLQQQINTLTEQLSARRRAIITQTAQGNAAPVDNALATLHGILRLFSTNASFAPVSRPEAIDAAIDLLDRAVVDLALIPPGDTTAVAQAATDQQLQEFFDEHAATPAAEDPYGISYLRPDALTLEYILVSKPAVETLIELDDLALRRFYDDLPETQRNELGDTFADARQAVEAQFRSTRAEEALGDAAAAVRSRLQNARRGIPRIDQESPVLDLPPDWPQTRPTLDQIATVITGRLPAAQNPPTDLVTTSSRPADFITRSDIQAAANPGDNPNPRTAFLAPIASATLNGEYPATSVLFLTHELDLERPPQIPVSITPQADLFFDRPFTTEDGSILFIRPLVARPESPPPSWTDIEGTVRNDFARVSLYNDNLALKDDFALALAQDGIDALQQAFPSVGFTARDAVVSRNTVQSSPTRTAPLNQANRPAFRTAVMDLVRDWPLDANPQDAFPPEQRAVAVGIPQDASIIAAVVKQRFPVTRETFADNIDRVLRELSARAFEATQGQSFFSFDSIAERLGYRDLVDRS